MSRTLPTSLRNRRGQRLDFAVHPGASDNPWIVVLGHGVTGNKDRPLLVTLAETLSAAGFTALRLSFSGNGTSEGTFGESTISAEVEDLGAVFDALPGWRIAYAGHSMGGAVGVLRASQDPRLERLISLAGMVHTAEFARREFGALKPGTDTMWEKPECPLSVAYLEDMNRIGCVLEPARGLRVPWLLVHGSEDDVVPIQDSRDIVALGGDQKTFVELVGSDHVFSGDHANAMAEQVACWMSIVCA